MLCCHFDTLVPFKIFDPHTDRYEVPLDTPPLPTTVDPDVDYLINFTHFPFGLTVTRRTSGHVM